MRPVVLSLCALFWTCTPHSRLPFEPATGVISFNDIDPDPLCRFKYARSSEERLEIMLSDDPFNIYEDEYEVLTPYRLPDEVQQRQLPRESYTGRCLSYHQEV